MALLKNSSTSFYHSIGLHHRLNNIEQISLPFQSSILSFLFILRTILFTQICTELWPSPASESWYFLFANLFLCYLGPLIVISICYVIIWKNVAYRKLPRDLIISRKNEVYNRSKVKVSAIFAPLVESERYFYR